MNSMYIWIRNGMLVPRDFPRTSTQVIDRLPQAPFVVYWIVYCEWCNCQVIALIMRSYHPHSPSCEDHAAENRSAVILGSACYEMTSKLRSIRHCHFARHPRDANSCETLEKGLVSASIGRCFLSPFLIPLFPYSR